MEEDGVEYDQFGVTDYELEDAINPGRYRKRATKHQQIYGIWADDSDEEDQRPSFGSRSAGGAGGHVNFVSGGFKQPADLKKEGKNNDNKQAEDEEKDEKEDEEEKEEEEERDLRAMMYKKFQSKNKLKKKMGGGGGGGVAMHGEIAGMRSANDKEIGSWEKHTKGIGHKLLLQMGYQPGRGLGKELQGISQPVEAKKRPGKGAIGIYGSERTNASLKHFPQQTVQEEQEEKEFRQKLQQWKVKPGESAKKKNKVNYIYRTVEDVKSDGIYRKSNLLLSSGGGGGGSAIFKDKVIDMTGPQQRILSGYHSLQSQHMLPETKVCEPAVLKPQKGAFEMTALLYNINTLIDMSEQEIVKNDRDVQYHQDLMVTNGHQEENMDKLLESESRQIKALEKILELIDRVDRCSADDYSLEDATKIFKSLQDDYYEEYKMFGLADLAVPVVYPLVAAKLSDWHPLEENDDELRIFKEWKDILEDGTAYVHDADQLTDMYHRMVWDVWMPKVRQTITNDWSARNCDPMISFFEAWLPVVPEWVTNNLFEQFVSGRLQREVDQWNPLTDTTPIHSWIHPWLPLLGERLEPLYAPIRQKLGSALSCWHPSDQSAKLILQPWLSVFSKGTMHAFVQKNIVPKLTKLLQEFIINPHQQQLEPWNWVMEWQDFLPVTTLVNMLDKFFFPRWMNVLCTWLNSSPDYEEVTNWYRGWKAMFSNDLLSDQIIKGHFGRALELFNRAVSQPQSNFPTGNRAPRFAARQMQSPQQYSQFYSPNQSMGSGGNNMPPNLRPGINYSNAMMDEAASAPIRNSGSLNFKDLIAMKAEENNVLFMPIPNRNYEGRQVYRFGKVLIYIDRNVVLYLNGDHWMPTSIANLISAVS